MPKVRVDILKGKTKEWKDVVMTIIHDTLVEIIKIPENDRMHIIQEHSPENFHMPNSISSNYINVDITMYPGRTLDSKRKLLGCIVSRLGKIGIMENEIMITLHEPDLNNWSS